MKNYLLIVAFLLLSSGCTQKPSEADKTSAEATIKGFYSALEKFDYVQMKTFCAPDFSGFEDGKISNSIDDFIEIVKTFEGSTLHITMNFVKTDVVKDMAYSIVKFVGHFKNDNMDMTINTFENYVLKKSEGKWLISFYHSSYLPVENDKSYTSIHLLRIPESLSVAALHESVKKLNVVVARIGYPDCGYSFMNIVPEKDEKYNQVMLGKWRNPDVYKMIHDNPEYKKVLEEEKDNLIPFFKDQMYVKYIMP